MSAPDAEKIPVFAALKGRDRDKVLANATQRTYAPGATLVQEGEHAVNLFFVVSGRARVQTAEEGQRGELGPGDFFGELALLDDEPRSATVAAMNALSTLSIAAFNFRSLLKSNASITYKVLLALCQRLRTAERSRL
jgi:CRP/FNR family cyclic AMP-dependent transcriptional regulator